jgi:hypothetical protein
MTARTPSKTSLSERQYICKLRVQLLSRPVVDPGQHHRLWRTAIKLASDLRYYRPALYLLALAIIAWYFRFIGLWARNIPFNDDILDVLRFMVRVLEADSARETIGHFLAPHVDHRTTASRLIYYLVYRIEGQVNFVTLNHVANFGVVVLAAILVRQWRETGSRCLVMLLVCLLLFQPRAFGPMFCAMCGFAFFYVNVYGVASIALLRQTGRAWFAGALACAVLANFTLASGQLLWPVGLAYLLYQRWHGSRSSWAPALAWTAVGLLCITGFHYGWEPLTPTQGLVEKLAQKPAYFLHFTLAVLGSAFAYGSTVKAECFGVLLLLGLCLLTLRDLKTGLSPFHFFGWYMVAQCLAIAVGRAAYADLVDNSLVFATVPRYSFTSLVLTLSVLLAALSRHAGRNRIEMPAVLLFGALSWAVGYYYYTPEVEAHWRYRLKWYNQGMYRLIFMPTKKSNAMVQRAVDAGIYVPPQRPQKLPD